ncbi:MAG: glutathione peroxidase [Proteiniphilum sp.]|jgi:glutathione peroxidase|uniref:glutathione peroxidase n=1 Tax=Proteiniphilum sp. TaxID=1926877 RepID=UPI002B1FA939|nr:glutathione peroxidase [Proteiniphilum sp.]MEA5127673.1 glutathione peroxidase [Proteiniphilum sp.]
MATLKQRVLRFLYPFIRKAGKAGKNGTVLNNEKNIVPQQSFYTQKAILNNGKEIDFSTFSGKKILIVNTASNCGYTGQYAELQSLHEKIGDKLVILAFPANDFAEQEKSNDNEIAQFCQMNYGVTFPIAKKGVVVKNAEQQPVFKWLSDSKANGWNDHAPDWNFSKYVIDEKGNLTHYFGPSISPLDNEFLEAVRPPHHP